MRSHPRRWRGAVLSAALWLVAVALLAWFLARQFDPDLLFGYFGRYRLLVLVGAGYTLACVLYAGLVAESPSEGMARCALASGALVVAIGALESTAALGLVDYGQVLRGNTIPVGRGSFDTVWWRFDPELIHIRHPHQRIRGRTSGDIGAVPESARRLHEIEADYDANGFRNSPDRDRAAVVIIGDSFVEAGLVAQHEVAASLLQERLGVPVANLGVTMYGPQQELAVLRRYGVPLRPRVVLWFFFEGNDLGDTADYESKRERVAEILEQGAGYRSRSFVYQAMRTLARWATPSPKLFAPSCEFHGNDRTETLYFRYGGADFGPDSTALSRFLRILSTAHLTATRHGAAFAIVYVPTKFRVYHDRCDAAPEGLSPASWPSDDLPDLMRAWTATNGVPFLDLTAPLRSGAASGELLYFPDDSHWTAKGHEVVTDVIIDFLDANGWIAGSPTTGPPEPRVP